MAVFVYRGFGADGRSLKGILTADTPEDARHRLREQGVHVKSLDPVTRRRGPLFTMRARNELTAVSRQLATLLSSGTNLAKALQVVQKQIEDKNLRAAFMEIHDSIARGISFGSALDAFPEYFSPLYVAMVKAGESSGTLGVILGRLAVYFQYRRRVMGGLSAALVYPAIVITAGVGLVIFLMTGMFPKIIAIMMQGTRAVVLPLPTRVLLEISNAIRGWWWLILILAVAVFVVGRKILASERGRFHFDRLLLRIPVLGPLFEKTAVSRFATTFSTLLESGITPIDALLIVQDVLNNKYLEDAIVRVRRGVVEGSDISAEINKTAVFPPIVGHMIAVGEESGELENLLKEIALAYDVEVDRATQKLIAVLGPVMILCMAGVILFIALAVVLPIQEIGNIH
ncbi:MAG: type II secretion system F family protein [Planctomycetota bacterium]